MYFCSMHHALIINTGFSAVFKIKQTYIGAICSCVVWVHILTYLQHTFFLRGIFFNKHLSNEKHFVTYCHFYPRPVLAFGYCHRLRLWVCVSVCVYVYQSRACPHDNSSPIQARITKFGPQMQNTLVWVPIVFGDDRP